MLDTVLLLAGGESSRFWPLYNKPLFTFLDKPLVVHQIERFRDICSNIVICVPKDLLTTYGDLLSSYSVTLTVQEGSGQAAAVYSSKDYLKGSTLIANINDIYEPKELKSFLNKAQSATTDIVLMAQKIDTYFPGGYIVHNEDGTIQAIIEKPGAGNEPSDIVRIAVDYFSDINQLLDELQPQEMLSDDYYEQTITRLANKNIKASTVLIDATWYFLKYPWHVLSMQQYFLDSLKQHTETTASVHSTAIIEGAVYLGKNVLVHNHAKIVGPTYISDNAIVGSYSTVINSHVGANAVVGGYSEVSRSYIGNKTTLHRNYIGDSVIGNNCLLGAGAITSNYRFDGKELVSIIKGGKVATGRNKLGAIIGDGTHIGCNATLYPSVKIVSKTTILPGTIVSKDIV
jgi:UDP-N-acetylglucosamine diphosphorylase / glucose-1-phosphate thymidylyltransferase / UDP-N-acetylgalactosamine diphosphorylase / glucosamine-1-phosphate N-acetyltransferase / galactosamine-1-phosphate N-acetyltransferase